MKVCGRHRRNSSAERVCYHTVLRVVATLTDGVQCLAPIAVLILIASINSNTDSQCTSYSTITDCL
jgi:hypothetical protein